jgi:hypothetical protein
MAGASLIPEFYKEKVNVAVLLAPPASLKNNQISIFRLLAQKTNRVILTDACEAIGLYNLMPYNFINTGPSYAAC